MDFISRYLNQYLEKKHADCLVEIEKERCVALGRFCKEFCVRNCPNKAISVGTKKIDEDKCSKCGVCITSCPNSAISYVGSQDDVLVRHIIKNGKDKITVRFSCNQSSNNKTNRKSNKKVKNGIDIDGVTSIEVECLARLHPGLILAPMAIGTQYVWLDISGCSDCSKNGNGEILEHINKQFAIASEWLSQLEIDQANVMINVTLPDAVIAVAKKEKEKAENFDRRDFFKNISREVKTNSAELVVDVVDHIITDREKKERMKIAPKMRKNSPPAHRQILLQVLKKLANKKEILGDMQDHSIMTIKDECTFCAICSRMCPAGAIELHKDADKEIGTIKYSPSYCLNCRKCEGTCPSKVLSFTGKVDNQSFISNKKFVVLESKLEK